MELYPRTVAAVLAALLTLFTLVACGGSSSAGSGDSTLTVGWTDEPSGLDYTTSGGAAAPKVLFQNVYETLAKIDQEGKVAPSLAKSWNVSADGKTYTFHLVDNATFSSGVKFSADTAKFSIEWAKNEGPARYKSTMAVVDTVTAKDPTTIVVTLSRPSNDWLFRMATTYGSMFSPEGIKTLATQPTGTGPFKFSDWKRGDSLTLVRNDGYWGEKAHYKTVVFKYFKDNTAINNALASGTINVIGSVTSPDLIGQFKNDPNHQIIEGTSIGKLVLSFNNSKGPMANIDMRKAVKYGIDHRALMDTCFGGHGTLIGSHVPPTDPWYEDLTGRYPYDPAKAKDLLAASGQASQTIRLRIPTLPDTIACGQVVKSQLEDLGFKVALDQLEFPAAWLTTVYTNADYDMSMINNLIPPRDMCQVFSNPQYFTHYGKPEFAQLCKDADEASTPEKQIADMKQAAEMLSDDAAADWLFLEPNLMVAGKDITGLPKNFVSESFELVNVSHS